MPLVFSTSRRSSSKTGEDCASARPRARRDQARAGEQLELALNRASARVRQADQLHGAETAPGLAEQQSKDPLLGLAKQRISDGRLPAIPNDLLLRRTAIPDLGIPVPVLGTRHGHPEKGRNPPEQETGFFFVAGAR